MASIQVRKESNTLIVDFYYQGRRCREQTELSNTPAERRKLQKLIDRIESEIRQGTFDYAKTFPGSKQLQKLADTPMATAVKAVAAAVAGTAYPAVNDSQLDATPLFKDFVEIWFVEKSVEWRKSYRESVRMDIDKIIIPRFGEKVVGRITKADILSFRADLAKVQARGKNTVLSNRRINKLLAPLRMILSEAADRFDFRMPFQNIKQLKVRKTDVQPFSLEDVRRILDTVRPDYRNYFTVRFFTGMRTGEVDGLQWKYVDFERRLILVRETIVAGEEEYTKNDGSQRDIQMSQVVFDALKAQEGATRSLSKFVFCNRSGQPLAHKNVTNRVWYPLLRHLGIAKRRPYQCRHTAATLWLASGESPQWIAMQLGHTTTEMLFRVYARFVPNLTRQDGSAFERLLMESAVGASATLNVTHPTSAANDAATNQSKRKPQMSNTSNVKKNTAPAQTPFVNQPAPGTVPVTPPGTALIKAPTSAVTTLPLQEPVASSYHPRVFPPILRVESIAVTPMQTTSTVRVTAVLFHEPTTLRVTWVTRQPDIRVRRGSLVGIKRARQDLNDGKGALIIDRLVLVESADAVTNLFKTIPHSWVADRTLVAQAAGMWEFLPRPLAHLMNAVFWDGGRFHRYVRCPSSISHHHNRPNGTLEHSVDVVERALGMAGRIPEDQTSLLIFGGLMHDAGKADEYDPKSKTGNYCLTMRGKMVGHKQTLIEWLAVARRNGRVILSEEQYLLIINMLTSNPIAPNYLGIPKPVSELASILSAADRVSGDSDTFTRYAPKSKAGGLGPYQKYLGLRSFALSATDAEELKHRPASNDPEFEVELSLADRMFKGFTATLRAVRQAASDIRRKTIRVTSG